MGELKIGNYSEEDFNIACFGCDSKDSLSQVAFRNNKMVIGYLFVCNECMPSVLGSNIKWNLNDQSTEKNTR